MQAIQTRFFGPGNVRGSRVKAFAEAGSLTVPWDHRCGPAANHAIAAGAFARKFKWSGTLVGGSLPNGDYAWVWTDRGCDTVEVPREERSRGQGGDGV